MNGVVPRALLAAVSSLVLAGAVAGCGGAGGDDHPGKPDLLLTRADLAPLVPSAVSKLTELPPGTQYYSCSEASKALLDEGWSFQGRDFRNTQDGWAVDSVVLDNPKTDSAVQVAQFREQVDACNAKQDANLVELSLGKDRYAYRSITPDKRVDTVRAYALVGAHRLVQVTVFGLDKHSAPDRISSLVKKAVQKAG